MIYFSHLFSAYLPGFVQGLHKLLHNFSYFIMFLLNLVKNFSVITFTWPEDALHLRLMLRHIIAAVTL